MEAMQSQTEEIKKVIHKHQCRNIEIVYEPGKTALTEQDEQLLTAYTNLHDFEWRIQKAADKLFKDFVPVDKKVNTLREQLATVKACFKNCAELADMFSEPLYIITTMNIDALVENQMVVNDEIQRYHKDMLEVYESIKRLEKKLDDYKKADEDESNDLYDVYSNIAHEHSKNYEINTINIVEHDDEYNRFCDYRSVHDTRRKDLLDFCHEAIENYTRLNLENTALYDVWTEFIKRCNVLKAKAELYARIQESNNSVNLN